MIAATSQEGVVYSELANIASRDIVRRDVSMEELNAVVSQVTVKRVLDFDDAKERETGCRTTFTLRPELCLEYDADDMWW